VRACAWSISSIQLFVPFGYGVNPGAALLVAEADGGCPLGQVGIGAGFSVMPSVPVAGISGNGGSG
jgi:hypothetical protein